MFPLKKQIITINDSETKFLENYKDFTEIPILPHPGAFSKIRKHHIHEGVDIYCEDGDDVYSMEKGKIINILPFTGEHAGSPWWNETWSILVEHKNYVLNYGEVIPNEKLFIGKLVSEGELLGKIKEVLRKDKGRPRSMLHLEMYELGTTEPISLWGLEECKAKNLLDPTQLLMKFIKN